MQNKLEREFQNKLVIQLKRMFSGAIVLVNDFTSIRGFPDILILYKDKWACLECKRGINASKRPNQEYFVNKLNGMSFARFIYPENREEVLDDLQQSFRAEG